MASIGGPNIVESGLVLSLDAANIKSYTSGSTTWFDKSGRGNNGTLTNGPTFDSLNGGSIVFDGTNDYISLGTGTSYAFPKLTYEVWVKTPTTGSGMTDGTGLLSFGYGNSMFISPAGALRFIITSGSSVTRVVQAIYSGTNLYDNQWHHIVCSRGDSTYEMYIDKVLVSTGASTLTPGWDGLSGYSSSGAVAGSNVNSENYKLKGNLPLIRVYNRALSAQEVLQNYNATKGRFNL
jgi:hypothetical protein